jgi:hypothetical protein
MFSQDESPIARLAAVLGIAVMLMALSYAAFGILVDKTNTFESIYMRMTYPDSWQEMDTAFVPDCEEWQCVLVLQQMEYPNAGIIITRVTMNDEQTPQQLESRSRESVEGDIIGLFDMTIEGRTAVGRDMTLANDTACDTFIRQIYATRATAAFEIQIVVTCQSDFVNVIDAIRDMLDSLELYGGNAI